MPHLPSSVSSVAFCVSSNGDDHQGGGKPCYQSHWLTGRKLASPFLFFFCTDRKVLRWNRSWEVRSRVYQNLCAVGQQAELSKCLWFLVWVQFVRFARCRVMVGYDEIKMCSSGVTLWTGRSVGYLGVRICVMSQATQVRWSVNFQDGFWRYWKWYGPRLGPIMFCESWKREPNFIKVYQLSG